MPWLSIVPIAESRSSYNGLLVFVFIAISASLAAFAIHRFASRRAAPRAAPGIAAFPIRARSTQYTAGSFAQPIRRVFGTLVFRAREQVDMPPPGDTRPARFVVVLQRSRLGLRSTRPIAGGVDVRGRPAQRCSSSPSAAISASSSSRWSCCSLVLALWP